MEKTGYRVAFGLMCGLAMCCSVMYMTADGSDIQETVLAPAKSVYGIGGPTSVDSTDVEKTGTVFTNTPDGRMRLTDYLTNVEKEIAAEEAARKRDVEAVRAQMDRNMAFNSAARNKLQKAMLVKMAANAKIAKENLAAAMRHVQKTFADAAALSNKRNKANLARSKHIREVVAKNKALASKDLAREVSTQQEAMAALASMTNSRIHKTDTNVAINAAQITSNAKKAHDELTKAVGEFDTKVANARAEAAAGRGKLATQLATQDKSIRQWANNKMKVVMAKTAAQFARVRAKMAEDRARADRLLKAASSRMTASMDAFSALNDSRFAQTVKDIATAKKEAKDKVAAAKTEFKSSLFVLTSTVNEQVQKTNNRMDALSNTVTKNKVAQAKINANVAAETKRMIVLGNNRYSEHLKKDKELKDLIATNKAATDSRIEAMGAHYTMELNKVRNTMKKNRAHATHMLAKKSAALYAAIEKGEEEQAKVNGALQTQTREANMAISAALTEAKQDFADRIGKLSKTVADNDKKFEGKIDNLTGIVRANAVTNEKGRSNLKKIMDANKSELHASVSAAINKGEKRMQAAETKLTNLNTKTKAALNLKIKTDITNLEKRANDQIEGLRLQSKEARAEMKKELLYAVRSMAKEAKTNLDAAKKNAEAAFIQANSAEAAAAAKSAKGRAALADDIAQSKKNAEEQLEDAVSTMQRSLMALKMETAKKIKKTNTDVAAYAKALAKEATEVSELMDAQMTTMNGKIANQKAKAAAAINQANAGSVAGFKAAQDAVAKSLKAAQKRSDSKFGKLTKDMAKQRGDLDKDLAGSVNNINDSIAKQAALADNRFSKTVGDIKAARKEASDQVVAARKDFATSLAAVTASIKDMETVNTGNIQKISGQVISHKAAQAKVNRRVNGELNRIEKLVNHRASESKKARGKLRTILDENKRAASEEVKALDTLFKGKLSNIRSQAADDSREAKQDLTDATADMSEKLERAQREQLYANQESATAINKYSTEANAAIAASKKDFEARLDTLTNTVAANHKTVEKGFEVLTGVIRDYNKAGKADRALIRKQNAAMNADMNKAIVRAIDEGETRANAIGQRARQNLAAAKKSMLVEITNRVEAVADMTFKTIQGKHSKVADNYLSLKAYAVTASNKLDDYTAKGKGKNLSSLGDLLTSIASLSDVKESKQEGLSASTTIPSIFSGGNVKVDNSVSKINGLVNEFTTQANSCRKRWPMGLGKYLLTKLEASMSAKGVLQVDKLNEQSGNFVFVNGHAVGLSNKLNDFESLAVRMGHYEATLAKLTAGLSGKVKQAKKQVFAKAPEWQGN